MLKNDVLSIVGENNNQIIKSLSSYIAPVDEKITENQQRAVRGQQVGKRMIVMSKKELLVLRHIGNLRFVVCPERVYGKNLYALNKSAAEVFKLWDAGFSADEAVESLKRSFSLPDGFLEQTRLCMAEFNKLAHGEISHYFGAPTNDVGKLGGETSFWENRIPVYGGIEPTWGCNLNCCHCYIRDPIQQTLPIDNWKSILNQLVDAGCLHLAITGGEPLFYKDFTQLYEYAVKSGFIVTVFTNGTLIDETVATLFAKFPPRRLEISIYGATERTYESVTRVKGSYERFIRGLDILSQYRDRVPVVLKSVLLQENVTERFDIQEIAINRGLALAQNSLIRPRLDGNMGPEEHRLTPKIVAGTEMEIKSEFDAWDEFAVAATPISRQTEVVDCSAGNVAFQIDPLGRLGYCVIARAPGINLLEIPMCDAWEILGSNREQYFKKPTKCLSCQDSKFCDFCPGYLSIGNKSTASSDGDQLYHCAVARDRHKQYLARQNEERRKY